MDSGASLSEVVIEQVIAYYQQIQMLQPTLGDWVEWVAMMPVHYHVPVKAYGLQGCYEYLPPFQRFLLEKNGYFLEPFLTKHLSREAWAHYLRTGNPLEPKVGPSTATV